MSMINFYDLNYELGVLLYRSNSEEELENFRAIIKALGFSRVLLEKIKEGFMDCCKKNNEDTSIMEKQFCLKLQSLNLTIVRPIPTTSTGESLFEYIGKEVMAEWAIKKKTRPEIGRGTILDIKFNPKKGDYEITFVRGTPPCFDGKKLQNYLFVNGGLIYASDIIITPIESE
jgi:hypothetical protein